MNDLQKVFMKGKAFIGFLTAGDPDADSTVNYILAMAEAGADLVEIGIPFSDPVAEGPVIQEASIRALQGGMTTDKVFDIVREVRKRSDIPLVFMTYLNPVFFYGYDKFFSLCGELRVSGIIIPDLPYEESEEVKGPASVHGVSVIPLIAPTSGERIEKIAAKAEGFIYIVSSMGVTGVRQKITTDIESMVEQIRNVTDVPCAVGFGISTPEQAGEQARIADGVIVGSAIVRIIEKYGREAEEPVFQYVSEMKKATAKSSETVVK